LEGCTVPKLSHNATPSYRKHRGSGQAVVTLNGRDHYLGRYGTAASKAEYDRLIAEWLGCGRQLPTDGGDVSMNKVMLAYLHYAAGYYSADSETSEVYRIKEALSPLKELFGTLPAAEFGPKKLKRLREAMLAKGWCRTNVNHQIHRVKRMIKWAVSEELVPQSLYHGLQTVVAIRKGMTAVREAEEVRPVSEFILQTTLPYLPPALRAVAELQLLTGMRPSEALTMKAAGLDATGRVWTYKPEKHKTAHHGHERTIFIGPKAQEIIKPWLRTDLQAYLFSPASTEETRNANCRRQRKTPMTPSQAKRKRKRHRQRPWGERYHAASYRQAILRACAAAFPLPEHLAPRANLGGKPETRKDWLARLTPDEKAEIKAWRREHNWHPNQLRHNAATRLRKEFGVELARIVLGHATAFTTEIYAEADRAHAMEVIAKVG
jgi:integrase